MVVYQYDVIEKWIKVLVAHEPKDLSSVTKHFKRLHRCA